MVSKKIELQAGSSLVLNASRAAHFSLRWAMVMLQGATCLCSIRLTLLYSISWYWTAGK